ncbi:MAG: acetate--CoA ligase family protein [Candidatus Krumholzibacteriia bacterium]|nr:acetate--CoA ligase family protein [bacterium]MCB9512999.1 acetate--CoA ligase family protein [Candidatus Latescibacterota bacterium]MCB9516340.1 acetate--CoA ligase family protein [Candidatus Latescibacterota bacterium]
MLDSLLAPRTVAIVGASATPGKVGHAILANMIEAGFEGRIVPVNPKADTLLGLDCVHSLGEMDGKPDLTVIAVPTPAVKAAVTDAIAAGTGAVIVITAGFKETGAEGAALEKEITQLCRRAGVRMMGPNCLGLINTQERINASFAKQTPVQGNISVLSQSGALCTAILDWAAARHLGLAKLISIGNKAELDETDFLEALAEDQATKVIVGYLENITAGDAFIKRAEAVAAKKPVVILKVGTTAAGGKAASSHTGSLAGADIAYGAAFKRAGVIRAEGFEDMFDTATALAMQPLPRGGRVAIITNAGGPGIMAADAVEESGLTVASLSEKLRDELARQLPAAASVGNPIDVLGDAGPERYAMAVAAAQDDTSIDAIIVILTPQAMTDPAATARAIAAKARGEKPLLAVFMGGREVMPGRDELVAAGLPDYASPERAVRALKAMADYAAWKERPPRIVTRFPVNRRRVERILHRHERTGRKQVGEVAAKEILRAYDFNVPPGRLATSAEEAMEVAERVGFPVAMKIASPQVVHKSDLGGVQLNLATPGQVRDAFELMMMRIPRRVPNAQLDGAYVEKMCGRGTEVIIGMTRDPQFGPMMMFGLGGIFVEVMKDVTFYLAPITADEAMQMLMGTRSYALLKGARGKEAVDLAAIASGLQRISQLATDFPQIAELDINPFIVGVPGNEPVVADARITLA